jgi:transposase-like protein
VILINRNLGDSVRWEHVYDAETGWLETIAQPESLRAAIWSELSRLTRGGEDQRRCAQCGGWFTIEVGQKRFDSRYDTNACKSKAHREKKKTAKRLKERGLGIREIAKALDSETAVVRGWIDPTKRVSKPKTKINRLRARQRVKR